MAIDMAGLKKWMTISYSFLVVFSLLSANSLVSGQANATANDTIDQTLDVGNSFIASLFKFITNLRKPIEQNEEKNPRNISESMEQTRKIVNEKQNGSYISQQCQEDVQLYLEGIGGHSTTPNWAKQMNDSYGGPQAGIFENNLYWLGNFWQCVSIDVWRNASHMTKRTPDFSGKYCLTSVVIIFLGPLLTFKIGMCLPSSCSANDFSYVVRKFYKLPFFVVVQDNFCQTKKWDDWDNISKAIGILFGSLAAIVVCGTIYEFYLIFLQRMKPKNVRKEMDILNTPCDKISLQKKNQLKAAEFVKDPLFQPILMGEFSVDTFFCMSGFLIAYLFLNEMQKSKGKLNLLAYYFHRFWRLSPAYMLLIAYMSAIYPYGAKGPIWPATYGDRKTCREKWWQNLLYINVYFSEYSDSKCLPQVWYLCLDMAYYVVSPIILYPLFKKPRLGQLIFMLFLITSFLTPALLIHLGNLASFPASNIEAWQRDKFMVKVYDKPWGRMPPFLVGMVYGYILHLKGSSMRMKPSFVATAWTLTTGIALLLIYGMLPYMKGEWGMSHAMFVFYGTFTRALWAFCVGWVILACATGYGGYVNDILSWRGFLPFSRLSYTAYLVHFTVLAEFYASRPDSTYIDFYTMTFYTIFLFASTIVVALIFTLIGEAPFITMEKLLFDFSSGENLQHRNGQLDNKKYEDKSDDRPMPISHGHTKTSEKKITKESSKQR